MPTEKVFKEMETHTPEEIVNALKVIKEVCSQHKCDVCPLIMSNGECGVVDPVTQPEDWMIRPANAWKAF